MKLLTPFVFAISIGLPASSQDLGSAMLMGLGSNVLDKGSVMLKEAPEGFDKFVKDTEAGRSYPSEEACLGELQVGVNTGVILSNMLPFSSVSAFEDERGPVGRFRLMLNGEKYHYEVSCNGTKLAAAPLPWGEAPDQRELVSRSSLDAGVGLLLLLQIQGAFEEEAALAPVKQETLITPEEEQLDNDVDVEAVLAKVFESKQKDGLGRAVSRCFNTGTLSNGSHTTAVEIGLRFNTDGTPITSTITMLSSSGGSQASASAVFETARRAIIRCGARGYDIENLSGNDQVIISFDPGRINQSQDIVVK